MKPMRILITAGPTREPIDPIRFITNYSTGAMGYAIAKVARKRRHEVILISGPTHLLPPKQVKLIPVTTANDMFKEVRTNYRRADCVVMAAAISDFRPAVSYTRKLKRKSQLHNLPLQKNADILYWLGRRKRQRVLIGFCMETDNLLSNAKKKLRMKKLDIIIANRIDRDKSAFGAGKTDAIFIGPQAEKTELSGITKGKIARILLDKIERLWYKKLKTQKRSLCKL